jgi:hypothetical protein
LLRIQSFLFGALARALDCHVASLLAMTGGAKALALFFISCDQAADDLAGVGDAGGERRSKIPVSKTQSPILEERDVLLRLVPSPRWGEGEE